MQLSPETGSIADWLNDGSKTAETRYNRRKIVRLFEEANDAPIQTVLEDIKADRLNVYSSCKRFLDYIRKDRASMTVYVYRSMIAGLWLSALGENNFHITAFNRLCPSPKTYVSRIKKGPSPDNLRAMLQMANPQYRAVLGVLACTGMRIGEVLTRKMSDLEIRQQGYARITLRASETKARYARFTFLTRECMEWINSYRTSLNRKSEYLFPGFAKPTLGYMAVQQSVKELFRNAGLKDAPDKSFIYSIHGFRTFCDAQMSRTGIDRKFTAAILGHRSKLAAEAAYMDWDVCETEWFEKCESKLTWLSSGEEKKEVERLTRQNGRLELLLEKLLERLT